MPRDIASRVTPRDNSSLRNLPSPLQKEIYAYAATDLRQVDTFTKIDKRTRRLVNDEVLITSVPPPADSLWLRALTSAGYAWTLADYHAALRLVEIDYKECTFAARDLSREIFYGRKAAAYIESVENFGEAREWLTNVHAPYLATKDQIAKVVSLCPRLEHLHLFNYRAKEVVIENAQLPIISFVKPRALETVYLSKSPTGELLNLEVLVIDDCRHLKYISGLKNVAKDLELHLGQAENFFKGPLGERRYEEVSSLYLESWNTSRRLDIQCLPAILAMFPKLKHLEIDDEIVLAADEGLHLKFCLNSLESLWLKLKLLKFPPPVLEPYLLSAFVWDMTQCPNLKELALNWQDENVVKQVFMKKNGLLHVRNFNSEEPASFKEVSLYREQLRLYKQEELKDAILKRCMELITFLTAAVVFSPVIILSLFKGLTLFFSQLLVSFTTTQILSGLGLAVGSIVAVDVLGYGLVLISLGLMLLRLWFKPQTVEVSQLFPQEKFAINQKD